ncbi:DNA primase [Candidatus Daviesbacteria bacterium]|nr:DNA primase [Candidatus Daviesbacteria bacterium]
MDEIELIKQKLNIVDLIQEYLPLKKSGVNFKANCPFHTEKTPSFMVSPERQIWHCFGGCQKGGDIFKFLMEKEGLEFKDALEILAKKAGVSLKRKKTGKKDFRDRLFEANLKAQELFGYILNKHPLGKNALDYLKKRGLKKESIEKFGIGYAPNSWDTLTKFLLKRGFSISEIINSGLGVASKDFCYDRFRARITFPLIDQKDRLIGFSGRVLYPQEPKYINTPQTPIFDKSSYLFGINLSKNEIRNKKEAILVEGEMDMIMSYQEGVQNIVATKGTALTEGQLELLKKYTETINLCFDMDLAGDSAARRGIEIADRLGLDIKVTTIADEKDAAELNRNNSDAWKKAVQDAAPIYDYYLHSTAKRFNLKNPSDFKKVAQELIPVWAKITDDFVREHYIQKLAAFLKIEEKLLRQLVNKQRKFDGKISFIKISASAGKKDDGIKSGKTRREMLEEYLIALLLHIPEDHNFVPSFPETLFLEERWKQIYVMLVLYLDSIFFKMASFNINEFVSTLPKDLAQEVDRLYLTELDSKLADKKDWQKEFETVITELKKSLIRASLERLTLEIKNAQEFGKIESLEKLNRRFRDLSVKLKNL